jgi:hypothetical protein
MTKSHTAKIIKLEPGKRPKRKQPPHPVLQPHIIPLAMYISSAEASQLSFLRLLVEVDKRWPRIPFSDFAWACFVNEEVCRIIRRERGRS